MKDFRNLSVWKKGHQLTLDLYKATAKFPEEEKYGLKSQIRRCSASIPANIAEGCGRRGNGEFHRFLQIASGSGSELEYHLLLSRDLGYLSATEHRRLTDQTVEVRRMLTGLIGRVEQERSRLNANY
jgi:four helix bundle protein